MAKNKISNNEDKSFKEEPNDDDKEMKNRTDCEKEEGRKRVVVYLESGCKDSSIKEDEDIQEEVHNDFNIEGESDNSMKKEVDCDDVNIKEEELNFTEYDAQRKLDADGKKLDADGKECDCVVEHLLKNKFNTKTYKEKEIIIKIGRPMPPLNLTAKTKLCIRKYNVNQYIKTSWLTGCSELKKLFCYPCLLFSNEVGTWTSNGFDDLNNIHKAIKRHEGSTSHIVSSLNLARFRKSPRINALLKSQHKLNVQMHNEKVKRNRDILRRLIDVVCYLGEQELAFRVHDELLDSANRDNFVELINLIKKYDPLFESYLEKSNVFTGPSNGIQNDLIDCVEKVLLNKIKNEINDSPFVSISLYEITYVRATSVLSKMVRYVNKNGEVCERFLGFTLSEDRTALGVAQIVFNLVNDFNIGLKFVAQTYDGAIVILSELNGLQKKVRQKYSKAMFIHCMSHSLNLVLLQSLKNINECHQFFAKLKSFSLFFSKSTKRMYLLDSELKKRFPNVAPTRWNYSTCLIETVLEYKEGLTLLFQDIVDNPCQWDTETYTCAQALLFNLEDLEFNFLLNIFTNIFSFTNVMFDIPQYNIYDINYCLMKINEIITTLQKKRDDFDEFWSQVDGLNPPKRRKKDSILDIKTAYRKLFLEILDSLSSAIEIRFQNLKDLRFLELLDPSKYQENKKMLPENAFKSLQENYGPFFDTHRLKNELLVLYTDEDLEGKPIHELLYYLKNTELDETLPQLTKLCELILTLPVISASASVEPSFSQLEKMHAYARGAQEEKTFSSLALISIEKNLLKDIKTDAFYEQVINLFNQKEWGIEIIYK